MSAKANTSLHNTLIDQQQENDRQSTFEVRFATVWSFKVVRRVRFYTSVSGTFSVGADYLPSRDCATMITNELVNCNCFDP